MNAYLRAYIVDPSVSTNGQPIGGLKGFVKILQKLVRQTKPNAVVVCWDGPNGSKKRKTMDKNYKAAKKELLCDSLPYYSNFQWSPDSKKVYFTTYITKPTVAFLKNTNFMSFDAVIVLF